MFLKPLMLAGLGAAVIPLVLHLLSKARYRTVEWGAMMFLEPGAAPIRQSARVKQTFMLLLRTAIIALLAVALARPVLRPGKGTGAEDARLHAIIILDRSASMGVTENGRPRLAIAKQAVINILSSLHRGDEVSLILTGDPIDPGQAQPTTDLQSVATRLAALPASFGRANIAAALEQARQALSREPGVVHELYLVCDQQASSWESVNDKFAELWQSTQEQLTSPLRFFVIPVGGEEADNIAIESVDLPGPAVMRDIPALLEIHLRNFGNVPRSDLPIQILANRKPIAQLSVNLAPGAGGVAKQWLKFPSSGSQVLSVRLSGGGMRADDQIDRAVDVLEPARVLIISGETRSAGQRTSADFLRLALSPFESSGDTGVDPASVRIIGTDDWWGISPDRDDIVILTNIAQLGEDQIRQLEQFTYGGGALIFAPGPLTDVESCNSDLYREGEGFLPASVKAPAVDAAPAKISQVDTNHPLFAFMRDTPGTLPDAPIARWFEIPDRPGDSRVLASLSNNQPLLIERQYGRGRVLMFTTTLGPQWNALPASDFYLPLMQSAVRYLAGTNLPDRNLKLGEPIDLTFDHEPAEKTALITMPSGNQRRAVATESGQRWTLHFVDTSQPGRYVVAFPSGSQTRYVVNAPRDESDPTPVSTQRWAWLQNSLRFKWLDSEKDPMAAQVASQRTGTGLHMVLIGVVIALALVEMALVRNWAKGSDED